MRKALLIATDTYDDPAYDALRAPRHDAVALADVLTAPTIGAFTASVLVNRSAHDLRLALDEFFGEADREDVLLLYLSGHGIKDMRGRLHFVASDTRADRLAASGVSAEFVRDLIDSGRARKVLVWLDCCYGGAFPPGAVPKAAGGVDVLAQLDDGRGCAVMTASTHVQWAYEPSGSVTGTPTRSIFTEAIVTGLRTGAADLDQDGLITSRELYEYVYEQVRSVNPAQTPTGNDQVSGRLLVAYAGRAPVAPVFVRPAPSLSFESWTWTAKLDVTGVPVFSPDGRWFVCGRWVWDTGDWRRVAAFEVISSPAFSPDGRVLGVPTSHGVELVDVGSWRAAEILPYSAKPSGDLSFSTPDKLLAPDATLWWRESGRWQESNALQYVPESTTFAGELTLHRLASGTEVWSGDDLLGQLVEPVVAGGGLVAGSGQVFDSRRQPLISFTGRAAALSWDTLAISEPDRVRLLDVASGRELHLLARPGGHGPVAISPDGRLIAASNASGTRLWARSTADLHPLPFSPTSPASAAESRSIAPWVVGPLAAGVGALLGVTFSLPLVVTIAVAVALGLVTFFLLLAVRT
ncbi:hypothetical protein GCM10022243_06660 [Saccharothrix violaceirubra]|uniref:Peptidase C14 caspase domain-containing protein n=1 Tax=Saccharothrix violaceirubra TaxID=413306 RepID=A0A7W7WU32_9PSEU|nr:caspase family protein [Saccharothrix violaceirubra]MBB4963078.1 hypothetical protein [Saccharothrix violaceirubra]